MIAPMHVTRCFLAHAWTVAILQMGISACVADWEGAKVTEELLDAAANPSNGAWSLAVSTTRKGCRVAKVEGNKLEGFAVRVDGVAGPKWSETATATPLFSEDGSTVAYCARRGVQWRWVINGIEGPAFSEMTATSFSFSADGERHAYVAIPGFRRVVVVIDGAVRESENGVRAWDAAPLVSRDGK